MKLVEIKCKNCGSLLKVDESQKNIKCIYCNSEYILDNEIQHVKYDDMEQAGYDFEKGKLRAQQEYKNENNNQINNINKNFNNNNNNINYKAKKNNNNNLWIILAWIFLLPFTLTYYIITTKKLDNKKKIIILIPLWIIIIIIIIGNNYAVKEAKKKKIIECYSVDTYNELNNIFGVGSLNGINSETECNDLKIKDENFKEIKIVLDDNKKLQSISIDKKYLYNIDKKYDIYDKDLKTIKEKANK